MVVVFGAHTFFGESLAVPDEDRVAKDNLRLTLDAKDLPEQDRTTKSGIEHPQKRFQGANEINEKAIRRGIVLVSKGRVRATVPNCTKGRPGKGELY